MSNLDVVMRDGKVHDPQRIDYMDRYLREFHRVMEDGVPIAGYTAWSIMDNFEWAEGFDPGSVWFMWTIGRRSGSRRFILLVSECDPAERTGRLTGKDK